MVREMFFRLETEFMRGSTFDVKMKDARLHSSNSSLFYYLQVEIRARNDEQALCLKNVDAQAGSGTKNEGCSTVEV